VAGHGLPVLRLAALTAAVIRLDEELAP
jgi:hypothetical protein